MSCGVVEVLRGRWRGAGGGGEGQMVRKAAEKAVGKADEEGASCERIAVLTRIGGFALVHAWTYMAFFSRLIHYSDRNNITHLNSMYALATCGIAFALFAAGASWFVVNLSRAELQEDVRSDGFRGRVISALARFVDREPTWLAPCAAATLSVCTVVLVMVENELFTQPWCSIVSVLSGIAVAVLFLVWISLFTRGSDKCGLMHLVASITLAAALFVCVLYLPKPLGIVLAVVSPLISLTCYLRLRRTGYAQVAEKGASAGGATASTCTKGTLAGKEASEKMALSRGGDVSRRARLGASLDLLDMKLLVRIAECLLLLGLAEGLSRATFVVINPIADTVAYRWIFLLGAVIAAAVVVASGVERPGRRPVHDVSRVSMSLLGFLILLVPIVHDLNLVSDCMIFVCHSLIYLLAWVVLTRAVDAYHVDVFAIFGVGLGGMFAGFLIGTFLGSLLTSFCELSYRAESLVALVCAGMVFAAFLFIADERVFLTFTGADEERPVAPRRFGLRIREIAESHGLTAKETEILVLISKGRTSQRIQEMLGISTGTMNTHMVHIYKKLGIHDRQQLLDMLEETE